MKRTEPDLDSLAEALTAASYSYCSGGTHGFYHYPARFAPPIAQAVISEFSRDDDVVLDPFVGGGTTLMEALRLGRRVVGSDINALAHFVSSTRTTPLSETDASDLRRWARACSDRLGGRDPEVSELPNIVNLPKAVEIFMAGGLALSDELIFPRQRAFARCALLRLGQWVLDCRDFVKPHRSRLARRLPELVDEMLGGLDEFVDDCARAGVAKHAITGRRRLLHRSAVGLDQDERAREFGSRPRLVFTSPPYPSVHVLYHRWQYRGRRETPAPYWIARVPDGYYESYYTGGSRTPSGRKRYFAMIEAAFRSCAA